MDKILSEIERQRRAENIYYTRRNGSTSFEHEPERSGSNIYKRLFQILLFINIVLVIFGIQNKGYVFKDEFIADVDVLIDNIKQRAEITPEEMIIENNIDIENKINNAQNNGDNEIVENITMSDLNVEKEAQKIEEEKEIEALIGMYQFKRPIESGYVITSRFGERNSENENVSEYHTGIDIGTEYGVDIKSAVTGIVTLVSNVGDYGKQVRIRNNNVTTLYAHCSDIFVKEGDIVADGQVIGKVGSTGNSTGPHLHFEIRVDDRCLDPEKLVSF